MLIIPCLIKKHLHSHQIALKTSKLTVHKRMTNTKTTMVIYAGNVLECLQKSGLRLALQLLDCSKLDFSRYRYKESNTVDMHNVSTQSHFLVSLMHCSRQWRVLVVGVHSWRSTSDSLALKNSEILAINILCRHNVSFGNRAVWK